MISIRQFGDLSPKLVALRKILRCASRPLLLLLESSIIFVAASNGTRDMDVLLCLPLNQLKLLKISPALWDKPWRHKEYELRHRGANSCYENRRHSVTSVFTDYRFKRDFYMTKLWPCDVIESWSDLMAKSHIYVTVMLFVSQKNIVGRMDCITYHQFVVTNYQLHSLCI